MYGNLRLLVDLAVLSVRLNVFFDKPAKLTGRGSHFLRDLNVSVTPNLDSAEQRKNAGAASDYQPFKGTRKFAVNTVLRLCQYYRFG